MNSLVALQIRSVILAILFLAGIAEVEATPVVLEVASPTISLSRGDVSVGAGMGIAYHPGFEQYYGANGTHESWPGFVWDASGNLIQTESPIGVAVRAFNYNPNTNLIEAVAYKADDGELWGMELDGNGLFTGSSSILLPSLPGLGDPVVMAAFDPLRNQFYSPISNTTVNVTNRITGALVDQITLGSTVTSPEYSIAYDSVFDVLITLDRYGTSGPSAYVYKLDGTFLGASNLPDLVPQPGFGMSYANGQLFVFDATANAWKGYQIMTVPDPQCNRLAIGSWNHHTYYVFAYEGDEHKTWEAANGYTETCLCSDTYLTTITTEEESDFMKSFLDNNGVNGEYWLGGFQDPYYHPGQQPGDDWNWVTGEEWDFTDWGNWTDEEGDYYTEPNDAGPPPNLEPYLTIWNPEHFGGWKWNDEWNHPGMSGYIAESGHRLMDIKPGSKTNAINCKSHKGVIPVALLTSECFDATTVDHTTVTFEGASETHVNKKSGEPRRHEEDVDRDGDVDLVFHFRFNETNLTCESTEGVLTGLTYSGIPIEGRDTVRMTPEKLRKTANKGVPDIFVLSDNFPNPFNPETDIRFQLPESRYVVLEVYNTLGQKLRTLINNQVQPGLHSVRWNGKDDNGNAVSSGIYIYKIQAGEFSDIKKMTLLR